MTEGILYVAPHELGLVQHNDRQSRQHAEREQPLSPWFLDNAQLRDARSGPLDRERRFRGKLDQLMELFASSQVTPLEFRQLLLNLLASR